MIQLSDGLIVSDTPIRSPEVSAVIETIRVAFAGLAANKLRTGLTILGLMIGVGSVIVLIAVGTGSSAAVAVADRCAGLQRPAGPADADARRPARRRREQHAR